jgi:hypothetical protein
VLVAFNVGIVSPHDGVADELAATIANDHLANCTLFDRTPALAEELR